MILMSGPDSQLNSQRTRVKISHLKGTLKNILMQLRCLSSEIQFITMPCFQGGLFEVLSLQKHSILL